MASQTSASTAGTQVATSHPQGADGTKQGWIHGDPVTDGWAGAVLRKPLRIQKCDEPTDLPTDPLKVRSRESATTNITDFLLKNGI